ncbi:hypothetical protein CPJ83_23200, partial [Salmonella enterica]|nr:hypothetical protein [Salmonella enterica]
RVSCRGVLISGCQEPYAQEASNRAEWCSRLLKMTAAPVALAGLSQTYVFKKKETACPAVRSSPPPSAKACWRCRTPRMS